MPNMYEIQYPLFLKCIEYTNGDKFWNNIFENLSYCICPYNIYIFNNYICSNHKIHKFKYCFLNKTSIELYNDIHKLFVNLGIMSNIDKKSIEETNIDNVVYENWSDIKKKSIKQSLIEKYIISKKKEFNLDYILAHKILNKLLLGLLLKTITSKHIVYKDNNITDITCLNFFENGCTLNHNIYNYNSNYIVV